MPEGMKNTGTVRAISSGFDYWGYARDLVGFADAAQTASGWAMLSDPNTGQGYIYNANGTGWTFDEATQDWAQTY
ncbi:MAG: hypothetical protein GY845_11425 [Planctomycetes bacterium]|nr:hypothetical protein [Planctomycetota bacterium]